MARKRSKKPEDQAIPAAPEQSRSSKDRHGPRRTVALPPDIYEQMRLLADENERPILWEIRRAIIDHLKKHGKWPAQGEQPPSEDEK